MIQFIILNLLLQIGLMRHGILLAEDNPTNLLTRFDTEDLEEVFLKLSLQQKPVTKHVRYFTIL